MTIKKNYALAGLSGGFLAGEDLEVTLDEPSVKAVGSMLGAGGVGAAEAVAMVAQQPLEALSQALGAQAFADGFGAAVLPDDGVEDRFASGALPHHGGFALVGDAKRGHVGSGQLGLFECGAAGGELAVPDVERVMLDPAGLREMLRKLLLGTGDDLAGAVEDDGA